MSASSRKPQPKPWPMKWIILSIVLFMAGYTVVNLYYRKPGQAYRPYQDAQDRATTARLLEAGWSKIQLQNRRPTESPGFAQLPATITREISGLGPDLESRFAEKPKLLATIDRVTAAVAIAHGEDYTIHFTASLKDLHAQVGELALYHRNNELVLVPTTEVLPGKELMSRWNDSSYAISFPTENLLPGRYTMRIVSNGPAAKWTFDVR